jgi:hypothetical protein
MLFAHRKVHRRFAPAASVMALFSRAAPLGILRPDFIGRTVKADASRRRDSLAVISRLRVNYFAAAGRQCGAQSFWYAIAAIVEYRQLSIDGSFRGASRTFHLKLRPSKRSAMSSSRPVAQEATAAVLLALSIRF